MDALFLIILIYALICILLVPSASNESSVRFVFFKKCIYFFIIFMFTPLIGYPWVKLLGPPYYLD
jgi:hypothetical protein